VVVFNQRVPESKAVAEYYARRRSVPETNLVGFDLPKSEGMTRSEYTEQLEKPLWQALVDRKLFEPFNPTTPTAPSRVRQATVRYAVLCFGVPTKILPDATLKEPGSDAYQAELRKDEAAVDSELAALPVNPARRRIVGPLENPGAGATNIAALHPTNGVLLVTRLDGPSDTIARGLVDKAMEAETNGLWGRAYIDARGLTNGPLVLGDNWLRAAAYLTRARGFETVLDMNPDTFSTGFPMSQIAFYAGWYEITVNGPLAQPTVEFMPGAFAYHLHSFNAEILRTTHERWVGPLLARGATATMGSVFEPYLQLTPDIALFSQRWFSGWTFAEAFYTSQNAISWQNLAVGDPLYRPFGQRPDLLHAELEKRQSKLVEWSMLGYVNYTMAAGAQVDDALAYLDNQPLAKSSPVLLEKRGDLYWSKKKYSDAFDLYEYAAKMSTSPMQKLRLLTTLAERKAIYGTSRAALEYYEQILKAFPQHPEPETLYRRILPLAEKAGRKDLVEKCEAELKRLAPAGKP
jgi:uncharacterized protein (TIGR03790 family)